VEALANKISIYLVSVKAAKEEDREIIAFGLFHIFANVFQIFILVIMALYFNAIPQITAFTLFFGSLKRYIGGAHASRNWICIIISTVMVFSAYLLSAIIPISCFTYVSAISSVVTLLLVLLKAPVMHPNNPKSANKLKKYRKIAITVAIIQLAALLSGCFLKSELARIICLCGSLGGLFAALSLIPPMPSYKTRGGESIEEGNQ